MLPPGFVKLSGATRLETSLRGGAPPESRAGRWIDGPLDVVARQILEFIEEPGAWKPPER